MQMKKISYSSNFLTTSIEFGPYHRKFRIFLQNTIYACSRRCSTWF